MLQASSQASWTPPSTKAAADECFSIPTSLPPRLSPIKSREPLPRTIPATRTPAAAVGGKSGRVVWVWLPPNLLQASNSTAIAPPNDTLQLLEIEMKRLVDQVRRVEMWNRSPPRGRRRPGARQAHRTRPRKGKETAAPALSLARLTGGPVGILLLSMERVVVPCRYAVSAADMVG